MLPGLPGGVPSPRAPGLIQIGGHGTADGALSQDHLWRLIPFLFGCYILAYVDRVNVGFAKLQMQTDLGMSDTVYGLGRACSSSAISSWKHQPI